MAYLLECRGVARHYDAQNHPLKSIDFAAGTGEFIAITGPSGAGKSTLLNILGMLDRPDEGTYLVNGTAVDGMSDAERDQFRGRTFGFVFQASHLISGRTVAQNLNAALQYSDVSMAQRTNVIAASLARVGMAHKVNAPVDQLSGGERQRVAIARALSHRPQVIFMDEPTGNLDESNTERVVSLIEDLSRDGATIVVVTHDDRVSSRADRRLRLGEGLLTELDRSAPVPMIEAPPAGVHRPRLGIRAVSADALFGILSKPFRAVIACAIVALGIAGLVVASGLSATASRQVDASIRSASGSIVRASFDEGHDHTQSLTLVKQDLARIASVDGVASVAIRWDVAEMAGPVLRTSDQTQPDFRHQVRLVVVSGHFFDVYNALTIPVTAAAIITGPDNVSYDTVVLGAKAAASLGVQRAGPGQVIWIGAHPLTVVGILRESATGNENLDDALLVGPPTGAIVSNSVPPGRYVVATEPGLATEISGVLPLALDPIHPEWVQVETAAQLKTLRATVGAQFEQLIAAISLVLVLLAVLVTSAITMAGVNARRSEIALRRAVGARRTEIGFLFTFENSIIGLVGGFLGVAVGEGVVTIGSVVLGWTPAIPVLVLIVGPIVGLAVAAFAAIVPASRSASIQPSLELHTT
ncbi:MAG: macrolide export ATP-binding/permease protein MacB [Rhodoglobus sp.]|nr:macrolide export ATP-binding/permease protein MacB [Rhodoglobus sp.]